jgi:hypothetical protein
MDEIRLKSQIFEHGLCKNVRGEQYAFNPSSCAIEPK